MKKPANLKRRFDDLRQEAEPPVEVKLQLDTNLHQALKQLAAQERLSLKAYILTVLSDHVQAAADEAAE